MIEKARQDLETNRQIIRQIRVDDRSEAYMSHRGNHEASVTSYVYEIRPKIQGPFDGCQRVLTKRENPGDDVANMYHGGPVSTNEHRRFALISREILFARDVKSGLLRFYNWRPFRNFKGMVVFSRSIHHGT